MNEKKENPELATFTLLNPDFSVSGTKQTEDAKKDSKQNIK
ncbi:hypothetical protein [Virgibacillus sp. YIM 98842]|nr:hypothetical protein [Virgibacillus sp. YIM 98842]